MRRLTLGCLLVFIVSNCVGQHKYIPFPDSNAVWVVKELDEFGDFERGYQFFVRGDTTINGNYYIKLLDAVDSTLPSSPQSYFYGIRNDTINRRVYIYDIEAKKEELLYDFSLNVGDTIPLSWGGSSHYYLGVITDIKTITIENNDHFVFEVDNNFVNPYIEGIGSLNGPFHQPYLFEGGTELDCFKLGKNLKPYFNPFGSDCKLYHFTGIPTIHSLDVQVKFFPNPAKKHITIKSSKLIESVSIYSAVGEIIIRHQDINSEEVRLDIQRIQRGIYNVLVQTREGAINEQIIIE